MSFEKWTPQSDSDAGASSATIVQSRLIRLASPIANQLKLRGKNAANLYYDRKRKIIGIQPIEKRDVEGAAKIRQSGKSTSIHVPSFFRHYQIEVDGIKRFQCWYDEKERMVMIDISRPSRRGRPPGS